MGSLTDRPISHAGRAHPIQRAERLKASGDRTEWHHKWEAQSLERDEGLAEITSMERNLEHERLRVLADEHDRLCFLATAKELELHELRQELVPLQEGTLALDPARRSQLDNVSELLFAEECTTAILGHMAERARADVPQRERDVRALRDLLAENVETMGVVRQQHALADEIRSRHAGKLGELRRRIATCTAALQERLDERRAIALAPGVKVVQVFP